MTTPGDTESSSSEKFQAQADQTNKDVIILNIAAGTSNPSKLKAIKTAFERVVSTNALHTNKSDSKIVKYHVEGFGDIDSGVPDQPFGDEETLTGAKNRAKAAHEAYKEKNGTYPDFSVGLEGGLEWLNVHHHHHGSVVNDEESLWCMAWMAVYGKRTNALVEMMASRDTEHYIEDKKPIFGVGKTGAFLLPSSVADLIRQGMELGHADDKIFGRTDSKRGGGTVGLLTNGIISRSDYYDHALVLALIPWIRPDVYSSTPDDELSSNGIFCTLFRSKK